MNDNQDEWSRIQRGLVAMALAEFVSRLMRSTALQPMAYRPVVLNR